MPKQNDKRNKFPRPKTVGKYNFTLLEQIGKGSAGTLVYKAKDDTSGLEYAIKITDLKNTGLQRELKQANKVLAKANRGRAISPYSMVRDGENEIKVWKKLLQAPKIQQSMGLTPEQATTFATHCCLQNQNDELIVVQPLVKGQNLFDVVKSMNADMEKTLQLEDNDIKDILLLEQLHDFTAMLSLCANSLVTVHKETGLVHGDLHPGNIQFDRENNVAHIIDFGTMQRPYEMKLRPSGNPRFHPAELFTTSLMAGDKVSEKTDTYSLASAVHGLTALRNAYIDGTTQKTMPKSHQFLTDKFYPGFMDACNGSNEFVTPYFKHPSLAQNVSENRKALGLPALTNPSYSAQNLVSDKALRDKLHDARPMPADFAQALKNMSIEALDSAIALSKAALEKEENMAQTATPALAQIAETKHFEEAFAELVVPQPKPEIAKAAETKHFEEAFAELVVPQPKPEMAKAAETKHFEEAYAELIQPRPAALTPTLNFRKSHALENQVRQTRVQNNGFTDKLSFWQDIEKNKKLSPKV